MLLKNKLLKKEFIITSELTPPKGTDCSQMYKLADKLKSKVDAVNITDSPMAKMKMSSIMAAHLIETKTGIETIPHISCRDKNLIALQGDLLGAANLGIKNILAVTGDDPTIGDHPQASPVFDTDSIGLIKTIKQLNNGTDHNNTPLTAKTELTVATAANLGADNLEQEIEKLTTKIEAGANFIQTQPAYDLETIEKFLAKTEHLKVPILIGILPLTSYKMGNYLAQQVPGIKIPPSVLSQMKGKGKKEGIKIAHNLLEKAYDLIDGIHLMSSSQPEVLLNLLP
ncbi:methylenetetrahydrofolate reductase [Natroniella sp. ANB-PHB2]|uniref:methylenetetrahydrofolate reductase n=1 Tax=Natroniella sp. ANB-PHB2 TaxID=3384444 RepID=UPI0038D511C5